MEDTVSQIRVVLDFLLRAKESRRHDDGVEPTEGASRFVQIESTDLDIADVTLTVSDGSLTATDTFVVTVSQVNDPPSFTAGADQVFTSHASGLVTALPDPWATAISPCPPSRPTCVGNEGTQNVTLSIANVSDPDDILSGTGPGQVTISSTTGTMSYFFNDDGGNPGFAPEGVVCFDVVATDDGTPPESATVQNVKIEVGNGTGSCIPSDQDD